MAKLGNIFNKEEIKKKSSIHEEQSNGSITQN